MIFREAVKEAEEERKRVFFAKAKRDLISFLLKNYYLFLIIPPRISFFKFRILSNSFLFFMEIVKNIEIKLLIIFTRALQIEISINKSRSIYHIARNIQNP